MKRQGKLFQSKLSGTGYSTYSKAPGDVKKLIDSLEFIDNYKDIQKVKKAIEKKGYSIELSMDNSIESLKKLPAKKVGYKSDRLNIVRTASTRMKDYLNKGYSRRDALINANKDAANIYGTRKKTNLHKDTKSHNVNIKVVSGMKHLSGVAPHKAKYFIEFMYQGIERTEYFDKLPAGRYKGMDGIIYVTRLTDYGTTLCPLLQTKNNLPLKK
jgi:hypothetical protein